MLLQLCQCEVTIGCYSLVSRVTPTSYLLQFCVALTPVTFFLCILCDYVLKSFHYDYMEYELYASVMTDPISHFSVVESADVGRQSA